MQKPGGKDPPEGDFSSWGRPLPPRQVDEALINESFEQFDFPADETDELNDETFGDVGPLSTPHYAPLTNADGCQITNGRFSTSSARSSSSLSSTG